MTHPTNQELSDDLKKLSEEVKDLTDAVSGLILTWKTASGFFSFIKGLAIFMGYCSIIGGTVFALWKLLKAGILGH